MNVEDLAEVYGILAQEKELSGIHLAGGEPFLNPDLLETAIRMAGDYGIPIDYVETNGAWASTVKRTNDLLRRMKDAGLQALLVSVSPFHLEYIPLASTIRCIEAAQDIFNGRVIIWQQHWLRIFHSLGLTERTDFASLLSHFNVSDQKRIPDWYSLTPGGRVPFGLSELYERRPAREYAKVNCRHRLSGTSHFHIDNDLNFIPDLCSGIAASRLETLHDEQETEQLPVLGRLYLGTLGDLMKWAESEHGYTPDKCGYVSSCHLCIDIRRHLVKQNAAPELRPSGFYEGIVTINRES